MKNNITKTDFTFKQLSHGVYRVIYTSPANNNIFWSRLVTDMEIIDATKNKENPTKAALNRLKRFVKNLPTRERKPVYKLSIKDGESDFLRDELDRFLWHNELIFVAGHKRYNFPTNLDIDFNSFDSWESIEKYLSKQGYKHIRPVYMLDHSLLHFSLSKFGGYYGHFDSGKLGFLASAKKGRKLAKAVKLYKDFLQDLEDYSNGDIKSIELTDEKGGRVEFIECFNNRLSANIKWLKKTYKNAKIIESE